MITGIVKDWRYKGHFMGASHPESPQRIEVVYRLVEKEIAFPFLEIEPRLASEEEIRMIHSPGYVQLLKDTAGKERVWLDPDTCTSSLSYEVARLAAGGLLRAADLIMEGKIKNAFALIRPPGHHAERTQARGFCIFNNIALAAEYLIQKYSLKRILIADWDLHHGNGTQNAFYSRNDVLYFSTHQFPYYPGSGDWDEVGLGPGEGYTINVPLRMGKEDRDYLYIYGKLLGPITRLYRPEFILVSAGFDIYRNDPLGGMQVSEEGFGALAELLLDYADEHSQGKALFALEGGYDPQGLQEGVRSVLLRMAAETRTPVAEPAPSESLKRELPQGLEILKKYWPVG
jgi:acetoin utilization deacetylase AcuC-like enzyme